MGCSSERMLSQVTPFGLLLCFLSVLRRVADNHSRYRVLLTLALIVPLLYN
jgi:hypothetical protein